VIKDLNSKCMDDGFNTLSIAFLCLLTGLPLAGGLNGVQVFIMLRAVLVGNFFLLISYKIITRITRLLMTKKKEKEMMNT